MRPSVRMLVVLPILLLSIAAQQRGMLTKPDVNTVPIRLQLTPSVSNDAAAPPGDSKQPSYKQIVRSDSEGPSTFERRYAFIDEASLWPFAPGQPKQIPVCWESSGFESAKNIVKTAISQSWQAHSGLRFIGWGLCQAGMAGIHIAIADSGPRTLGLGSELDGIEHGMLLNFTFQNWGQACSTMKDECIASIAVHEFGHAIGFAHEQNRPDTPGECREPVQGKNGTLLLTPYDASSVMNYCNPVYNNNGRLSESDEFSVARLYCNSEHPLCNPSVQPAT
jgi:hypothetical protein